MAWLTPTVAYDALVNEASDTFVEFIEQVCEAGILAVSGVPGFGPAREKVLMALNDFGNLPESVKTKYVNGVSKYNVGWSIGVESFKGAPDFSKGSFYANPFHDQPGAQLQGAVYHPEYHTPNIWPEEVPALEAGFKEMGQMMMKVAMILGDLLDRHMAKDGQTPLQWSSPGSISRILKSSRTHKARGLIYFPCTSSSWCGEHTDHGLLTGLVPAMFVDNNKEVASPDPNCRLCIASPDGSVHRVVTDKSSMIFQIGDTLQALSGGKYKATPHWVTSPQLPGSYVRRLGFALFFQPDVSFRLLDGSGEESVGWEEGMTFGEFAEQKFDEYRRNMG